MVCDAPSGGGVEIVTMPEFFDEKPPIETSLAHIHDFYEIVWFRKGSGTHHVDFNTYPVTSGTAFFISPGQVHEFDDTKTQEGYVLKVCHKLINRWGSRGRQTTSATSRGKQKDSHAILADDEDFTYLQFNVFNTDSAPYYHVSADYTARVDALIQAIAEENKQACNIGHEEYMRSLIRMLIITIQRGSDDRDHTVLSPVKTSHKTFLAFRQQIELHYRTLHTVKDYASLLGVSTKTLTNYVSECSPLSPLELINGRIVLEAKRLLRYSNLMIKETAFRLGFEDPSYFVKFFKRIVGVSPVDFRESTNTYKQ